MDTLAWQSGDWKAATLTHLRSLFRRYPDLRDPALVDYVKRAELSPTAWRLRLEGPDENWGHPVLVLELCTRCTSVPSLVPYENLWWAMDASEATHLRVFRADRRTLFIDGGMEMVKRLAR